MSLRALHQTAILARAALLAAVMLALLVAAGSDAYGYVSIRVPAGQPGQGLPVRWDLNNVEQRPNIANRRVLYEIGDFGCADADNFQGPINEFEAIQNSFATWRNIHESEIDFQFAGAATDATTNANDGRNMIRWVGSNISAGVFAVTVTTFDTTSADIVDVDMELNDRDFSWDTLGPNGTQGILGRAMIENVVTHEIGHFLGLDHSQVAGGSLYYASVPGLINQTVLRADDRAPMIRDHTSSDVTDPTLGKVSGSVTSGGNPSFGVEVILIDIAIGRTMIGAVSEGTAGPYTAGSFEIANVPPGNYVALAIPLERSRLGSYYSNAFTSFYPVLHGVGVGTVGAPAVIGVGPGGNVSGINIALPGPNQNPFEDDDDAGDATTIAAGQAAVATISPSADQDWYQFTTTQAGQSATVRVIADGFGSSLNPTLTLYGTNGSTVLVSPDTSHPNYVPSANDIDEIARDLNGANFDCEFTHTFANPGTYFFKVESRHGLTQGRYVVMLELSGEPAGADAVASGIESSTKGVPVSGGNFTLSVTPRNVFSRDIIAPAVFTVDLLDVTGATPVVMQSQTASAPFDFLVPALATAQRKLYSARIGGVQIAQTIEVVHYGALSTGNSRIVLLEKTLNANGSDRIPVRIEIRDGANNLRPDASTSVTVDTSRGTLANGSANGQSGIAAVFDADNGWWTIDLVAGTTTGTASLVARANGQQVGTAAVEILPRAAGTGGGPPGGSDNNDDGEDDRGGGCAIAPGGVAVAWVLMAGMLAWRRRTTRRV